MEQGNKIILILGILAIAAGVLVHYESSSFLKKSVRTEGKVVHVLGTSYRISYTIVDGTEKIINGSGKKHGYHEGDTVSVWYRTDNPARVRLSDGRKGTRMLYGAGIFCIILGIYPLFMGRKKPSENQ